jgi:AraC-like DNA-binding protein
LAELAGLSAGYFLRAFRRAYGVPPMVYQGRLRVAAARTLLRSTDLGCKEIADRLGYSDEFHFSKSFRRAAGCPPGQYRRSGRGA